MSIYSYRVTWIEHDGTISKQATTFSEYLARQWHQSGTIAKKVGLIQDCRFENLDNDEATNDRQN